VIGRPARVEIEAGRHGNARPRQNVSRQRAAVAGQITDIGIDIEGPVRRRDAR
jgi:hypothetical protein